MTVKGFEQRRRACKIVMLQKLGDHTIRATEWELMCSRDYRVRVTHARFWSLLRSILEDKLIEKESESGAYRATQLGKEQLELWKKQEKTE
jgi:DNA-binding PadR family transcriptional regulator